MSKCTVQYHTAEADINILVKGGILVQLENYRPKTFYSKEIIHVAYSEEGI
jgi:hypothetical protein